MENRGDFTVFNEPGVMTFLNNQNNRLSDHADSFSPFDSILTTISDTLLQQNVFIKEMFFAANTYLMTDSFLKSPDCYFVFLIRNPHHTSLSNFKKLYERTNNYEKLWEIKRSVTNFMVYSEVYRSYETVLKNSINKPYIIITEDLYEQPNLTLTHFCNYVDIPMKDEFLTWQAHGLTYNTQHAWNDPKSHAVSLHWHDNALASTHISKPSTYKTSIDGYPTFEEIDDLQLRGAFLWEYYHNISYYELFKSLAQKQN